MTEANDLRIRENSATFGLGFPMRSRELAALVHGGQSTIRGGRALACIDPRSRRIDWIRPTRLDGRRTLAPYADYADFMNAVRDARATRRRQA
jgi:hypothetical protein